MHEIYVARLRLVSLGSEDAWWRMLRRCMLSSAITSSGRLSEARCWPGCKLLHPAAAAPEAVRNSAADTSAQARCLPAYRSR